MTDEQAGRLGQLAVAAGAHAGVLLVTAGLGVGCRERRGPTRLLLLQAAVRVAGPKARWDDAVKLAALALAEAIELLYEGAGLPRRR